MKAKTCQYCCYAKEATASSRTILICDHKKGCEGKLYVVAAEQTCGNFQPGSENLPGQEAGPGDMDGVRYIPLTQGEFAIVDAEDYPRRAKYKWHCRRSKNSCYAFRRKGNKMVSMHREILDAPEDLLVDHIDGDGLHNRKSNLRLCTYAQNAFNRRPNRKSKSKYKGLSFRKYNKQWEVQIIFNGKSNYLGRFDDEIEAALAYDRKAEQLFGQFAYLNFHQLKEFRKHLKILFSA